MAAVCSGLSLFMLALRNITFVVYSVLGNVHPPFIFIFLPYDPTVNTKRPTFISLNQILVLYSHQMARCISTRLPWQPSVEGTTCATKHSNHHVWKHTVNIFCCRRFNLAIPVTGTNSQRFIFARDAYFVKIPVRDFLSAFYISVGIVFTNIAKINMVRK